MQNVYGEYTINDVTYSVIAKHSKSEIEALLIKDNTVISAYKKTTEGSFSYSNNKAKDLVTLINKGISGCTAKNCTPMQFDLGPMMCHDFIKSKVEYSIQLYRSELVGAEIRKDNALVQLIWKDKIDFPDNIPYVKLTTISKEVKDFDLSESEDELDAIPVRSVEEIALEKDDITWLNNKKYYIVNDDATAEQLFSFLDNYDGDIAYDVETTGLHINCFSKINSSYAKSLEEYNLKNPDNKIRADKLVGIIFCVEKDVSYYFPCGNRKFKNLYQDKDSEVRKNTIANIKARYTVGELRDLQSDMARYVRDTPEDEWLLDVILMERCRNILQTKKIITHGGSFEWKNGWTYEIDTNIVDDTILMHQLMYKFRSTTSNKGEPSNLKYLAKVELGIDQWELKDFFPSIKDDTSGTVRSTKKKKGSLIDFSYMDYNGTRIYAPTDGDVTFCLARKYKDAMNKDFSKMKYIYKVEVITMCAVAYMEYYGHKLNEKKINNTRIQTKANIVEIEYDIRKLINFNNSDEDKAYNNLKAFRKSDHSDLSDDEVGNRIEELTQILEEAIANNKENRINLGSPQQVCELFYDKLGIPTENRSVAKSVYKGLMKEKDDEGNPKYPVVHLYSKYKNEVTLLTKFFGNLQSFMYPGGYIFSSYGQISTATGRMSCSKPNAQQYPKSITKIVEPRPGYIMMDADYSQIEYRVLTGLAQEPELVKLFSDPDSDYHTLMASLMYGVPYAAVTSAMRSAAKSFNFGIPYGMGFKSLAILLTGKSDPASVDLAKEKYEDYFRPQPRTKLLFERVKEGAMVNKETKTIFDRVRSYSFTDKDGNIDQFKMGSALRQAGNAVIQGSAADIFKIGVARNFIFIRKNKLFGDFLITNMVHDEQLLEINVQKLNPQKVIAEVGKNMQFELEGFPPLFIGAGIGKAWGVAKGKMAEIHPVLLDNLTKEAETMPLFVNNTEYVDPNKVVDYFNNRVFEFRRDKVKNYLLDSNNWNALVHPAIGSLINLQFNYGRGDDPDKYVGPNGEKYTSGEFLTLNIADFINEYELDLDPKLFITSEVEQEKEVEKDYDDEEEEFDEFSDLVESEKRSFKLIDESSKLYGSSVHSMIEQFGTCILADAGICGIDTRNMHFSKRDLIIDYLLGYQCERDELGALEIVFLSPGNILNRTGVFVKNIDIDAFEVKLKAYNKNDYDYKNADIHTRSQAK